MADLPYGPVIHHKGVEQGGGGVSGGQLAALNRRRTEKLKKI